MYIAYLDASKAFDQLNYWKLCDKLLERKVPVIFVRFLMYWYTHQQFLVKWGNALSNSFLVGNGVRQGGVLSPILFNVYMDNLSVTLNKLKVGCHVNNSNLNHLMYADDLAIVSPSARALQILLSHCDEYAKDNDIIFSTKKSVCMCVQPKSFTGFIRHKMTLSNSKLEYVESYNYLGVNISSDMSDDKAIYKQCPSMYAKGNVLIRNFKACTDNVK